MWLSEFWKNGINDLCMMPRHFFSFTLGFLSLVKIGQVIFILQTLQSYVIFPAKNPTLLISGSVVTITSLSQWNVFDMRNISGGTVEQMMIINTLSILQFLLGWRTIAKKAKLKVKTEQEIDTEIVKMQTEINSLKSKLVTH
ncbi:MAG: hypothetical protein ACT4N5_02460 [Nitrosopumilaceae archaeon]